MIESLEWANLPEPTARQILAPVVGAEESDLDTSFSVSGQVAALPFYRLGFVARLPDDRLHLTRRDYEDRLEVFLTGRAAEEIRHGADQVSSGASRDLQSATALVSQMVTRSGLGGNGKLLWSDTMTEADLATAETIVAHAYDPVLRNLRRNEPKLSALAAELVSRQELPGNEVRAILRRRLAK